MDRERGKHGSDPGLVMRYYVPNADMGETRKVLREAQFLLEGREGMSSGGALVQQRDKGNGEDRGRGKHGIEGENIPLVNIDPMHYYLPDADMDETRAKLLKAHFLLDPRSEVAALNEELRAAEGHIRDCQGAGCGATCGCQCHAGSCAGDMPPLPRIR